MENFQGKTIIVTGAADGLGRATCIALGQANANVVLVDVDRERLAESERLVAQTGARVLSLVANVADAEAVKAYVAQTLQTFGRIDGFFNNAGVLGQPAALTEYDDAQFDKVIAVNVRGVYLGLKHVLPVMLKQGSGAIVNTASMAAAGGIPTLCAYTASKHAVVGLTRAAALEVARSGVRINAVLPGSIETKMAVGEAGTEAYKQRVANASSMVPQGHLGQPIDIAQAVMFLLSDRSTHITGIQLPVDGGITAQVYPVTSIGH